MSSLIFSGLMYLFGLIGLASIGLLPLRSWHFLRSVFKSDASHGVGKVLSACAVLVVTIAVWIDFAITVRIFRCLTQVYCGPSISSGWVYLAILGIVYFTFEILVFVLRRLVRTRSNRSNLLSD